MSDTPLARQMHFALMLGGHGGYIGGWRMPEAQYAPEDFELTRQCAQLAERAKFDMLFVADVPVAMGERPQQLEAMTELASLIGVTTHIGLAATVSTTYSEPYNLARMLASMDHLSGGRAAWNVVTTQNPDAAANFGKDDHIGKHERYEMAGEFLQVVKGLWDSWEDDAVLVDKSTGELVDFSKRHVLDHKGKYFSVKGPLNMTRPPQGYPVILQAGSSDAGLPFAAEVGEAIFTVQADADAAKAFCDQLRSFARKAGRNPDLIRVMPGICAYVADTDEEAKDMLGRLSSFIEPEAAWAKLTSRMGMDMRGFDPEGPIPPVPESAMRGHTKTLMTIAEKNGFNLRQLRDYAAAASGHPLLFGTAESIADELERWFRMGAADGFVVIPPFVPGPLRAFTEKVIPILQKRGLFRTDYTGRTLRDHLGLARPPHPAVRAAAAA